MKQKPYIFLGGQFFDLNSLALAYQENFEAGMDDIFTNAKKLIKFVKKVKKNKEFTKEIVSYLTSSKYKNNALTFIIFAFSDTKKVVINGVELSFMDYIQALKDNPNSEDNSLFAFLEDHGVSKTYVKYEPESKLFKDIYYIEKNCYLPFTYKYLTTYHEFEIVESLNGKISSVAINGEECFRRGTKITKNEEFQLGIAHKVGFKAAVDMNKDINPIFKAIKLLKQMNECEDEYLRKLISDTFYWWLLDNLDKYVAVKKEANQVFIKLNDIKKNYNKFLEMIETKKIYSISIELYADMARSLYLNYLEFVKLYKKGKINIRKKYDQYRYNFDKPYCMTYICQDYMNGKVIKLYSEKKPDPVDEPAIKINPLTGEVIDLGQDEEEILIEDTEVEAVVDSEIDTDDISDDAPIDDYEDNSVANKKLLKLEKKMYKNRRFASFAIFVSVLNLILIGICFGLSFFKDESGVFGQLGKNMSLVSNNIVVLACGVVPALSIMVLGGVLRYRAGKTIERINDALYLNNAKEKDELSVKQQKRLNTLNENESEIYKNAQRSHRILTCVIGTLAAISFAALGIFIAGVINAFASDLYSFDTKIQNSTIILVSILASAGVAIIFGLIKKHKGVLSMLLIEILSIAIAILLFFVM